MESTSSIIIVSFLSQFKECIFALIIPLVFVAPVSLGAAIMSYCDDFCSNKDAKVFRRAALATILALFAVFLIYVAIPHRSDMEKILQSQTK